MTTKTHGVGVSPYPELDAARKALMARLDHPGASPEGRQRDFEAYIAALRATGLQVRRVASLAEMVAARAGGRR